MYKITIRVPMQALIKQISYQVPSHILETFLMKVGLYNQKLGKIVLHVFLITEYIRHHFVMVSFCEHYLFLLFLKIFHLRQPMLWINIEFID